MKILLFLLFASILNAQNFVSIKYRHSPVDIDNGYFKCIDTNKSSFVRGACYDKTNKYMIISLRGTNYHYCGLDGKTWNDFKHAKSFGRYYNMNIKGGYDCRTNPIPNY